MGNYSRRHFLSVNGSLLIGSFLSNNFFVNSEKKEVDAHLWVYASRFPPDWDCTPILDDVFNDLKFAGYDGVEIMEAIVRHEGSVERLKELIGKYKLPVIGSSYYADMWNKDEHNRIEDDITLIIQKLNKIDGKLIGLTVGDARRTKTEKELDDQAELLKKVLKIAADNQIEANLHNHTFEVMNGLHDLKGTLARIPGIKLGPDINWLIRAGVDPVWFIHTYGKQMVYMHIRDQDASGKWTEAVGEGVTDFKKIAMALHDINYKGRVAVELAFDKPPLLPIKEDWKLSRAYVKKIFDR